MITSEFTLNGCPSTALTSCPLPSVLTARLFPRVGEPDNTTVPERSGKLIVLAAEGSVILNVVRLVPSAVDPSKTSALCPAINVPGCTVPLISIASASALPAVTLPFIAVLPVTVRSVVTDAMFNVASPLVFRVEVPIVPVLVMSLVVVKPVTPRVPVNEVLPVTPKLPPTVALFVTDALLSVARPLVVSVAVLILLLFVMFPVLPIPLVLVNPVTPTVPPKVALPFGAKVMSPADPSKVRLFPLFVIVVASTRLPPSFILPSGSSCRPLLADTLEFMAVLMADSVTSEISSVKPVPRMTVRMLSTACPEASNLKVPFTWRLPLSVNPLNIGDALVCISCGVDRVICPAVRRLTLIWLEVPSNVLYSFAVPALFMPSNWLEDPSAVAAMAFQPLSKYQKDFVSVSYTSMPWAGGFVPRVNRCAVVILGARKPLRLDCRSSIAH